MIPLALRQIAKKVNEVFAGHVPKEDIKEGDPEREQKVLTRCLAAFAVQALTQCSAAEAGESVVDGSDDNGIDAIYHSESHNSLIVVQSKWKKDGKSEPDSSEVGKFCNGIHDLMSSEFGRFNERVRKLQDTIDEAVSNFQCRLQLVLIHTGGENLAIHSSRQIEDLLKILNEVMPVATFRNFHQKEIYKSMVDGLSGGSIELKFTLTSWGKIEYPHTAYYGMVTGSEIANWWHQHGDWLFGKNLRGVLGETDVNAAVNRTISTRPDDFWYFNNGITVTAKRVEKTMANAGIRDTGDFRASGAFVVNGAQTVSTIGRFAGPIEHLQRVRIPLRVISLEGAPEDYGALITRTNNTQNRIEARDFVSQDGVQQRMQVELKVEGIEYHIVRSESFRPSEASFDLEEATIALACATKDPELSVQVKREIGRIWLDLDKPPYKRLFNPVVSSLFVYHCVLCQRTIDRKIETHTRALGIKSGRQYGILVHGNRLISTAVFYKFQPNPRLGDLNFSLAGHRRQLESLVEEVVTSLFEAVAARQGEFFPPLIFKNPGKSKELFDQCIGGSGQMSLGL